MIIRPLEKKEELEKLYKLLEKFGKLMCWTKI